MKVNVLFLISAESAVQLVPRVRCILHVFRILHPSTLEVPHR